MLGDEQNQIGDEEEQYGRRIGAALRRETEDLHAPPDLTRALRRRQARRTWSFRVAIAVPATAAAAAAAAVVVATTAGQGAPGAGHRTYGAAPPATGSTPVRLQTVGYVQARTLGALDDSTRYVIQATDTYQGGHYDQWFDRATQRYRVDTYDTNDYTKGPKPPVPNGSSVTPPRRGPHGLLQTIGIRGPEGDQDVITVDYELRKWFTDHQTDKDPVRPMPDPTDPHSIRAAVDDGTLDLLGSEKVGNHDTLHLRLFGPKRSYRMDLWVDSSTYLPVQDVASKSVEPDGSFPATGLERTTYTWLPRTPENLAHLVVTPPPGFRHQM